MANILAVVLNSLSSMIRNEIEFLGGLDGELKSIKNDLAQMRDFLEGADMHVQDHNYLRSWIDQVREVAYNIEDVLDKFIMHCTYRRSTRWNGVFQNKLTKSVGSIKVRHELATQIQEIKKRIKDISDTHHNMYKIEHQSLSQEQASSSTRFSRVNNMQYDKRCDALFLEKSDLVGIKEPKKELINLLLNGDAQRNAISVVGIGGLGKTTLIKQTYDDVYVRSQFDHHVWINVSELFNLEDLFKDVIRQLFSEKSRQLPQELEVMDINRLKLVVKDFLQTKKYIVVLDDVWQLIHWDAIHLAFPRNQLGSRVMITTRNNELGKTTSKFVIGGSVYQLRPLANHEAMQLFCKKAFPISRSCPQHLKHICENILGTCEGLPLAIEIIGTILATKERTEEWELFHESLGAEMKTTSSHQLDAMTKLLSRSYDDLPLHLKNCFLYLSIFPKNTQIFKKRLIRLWIGEGFVERKDVRTLEEVAESYLNELISRCLVQVAQIDKQGSIKVIRIHNIIQHIILLKASEQNITTIFREQEETSFGNNVRRLALHGTINDNSEEAQSSCKSIRTLFMCKYIGGNISEAFLSHLLSHGEKLVKVLDLKDAEFEKIPDEIFKLFHLKYLNLTNTKVKCVPKSIGMLQRLQTLNLLGTQVTELPVEMEKLQHLRHLIIGSHLAETFDEVKGIRVSFKIGNLKSLQQLLYVEAGQVGNIKIVTEIGKLCQLRTLGITKMKRADGRELCSSLRKLGKLHKLIVYSVNEEEVMYFEQLELPGLQILNLKGRLEYPKWISSLHGLTRIHLRYSKLRDDPLECFEDLPNLITLNLNRAYQGQSLCFKAGGFPRLKNLHLKFLQELRYVMVEQNAMPSLQELWIRGCLTMEDIPTGIENLRLLQELEFSNMSNEFVNKLESLNNQDAAYKSLLQIQMTRWSSDIRYFDRETWIFKKLHG